MNCRTFQKMEQMKLTQTQFTLPPSWWAVNQTRCRRTPRRPSPSITVGEEPHTARIKLHHKKVFLGKWTVFSLGVDALQIGELLSIIDFLTYSNISGPALVHLNFQSMLGDGVMIQYVLPVEENVQKLVHIFYTSRSWIPPYAKVNCGLFSFILLSCFCHDLQVVLLGESIQIERDIQSLE